MKEYVRLPEAADMLCIAPGTLRNWVQQKRVPAHKAGRVLLFKTSDIWAIIKARKP